MGAELDKLNQKQIDCLLMVGMNRSSKEIAPLLGLTHRTVDTYITIALKALEMSDRNIAARAVADAGAKPSNWLLQQLQSQSGAVDPSQRSWPGDGQDGVADMLRLPPVGGKVNELGYGQRAGAILKISLASALVLTALIASVIWIYHLTS